MATYKVHITQGDSYDIHDNTGCTMNFGRKRGGEKSEEPEYTDYEEVGPEAKPTEPEKEKVHKKEQAEPENTPSALPSAPSVLNTPEGLSVLSRYVAKGFLTKDFQPNHLSRTKAAIVAHSIATDLNIKNMWKVFGDFWNIKALSSAYTTAINQANISAFLKEIEKV